MGKSNTNIWTGMPVDYAVFQADFDTHKVSFSQLLSDFISVKRFVGDATGDISAEIQAAIDAGSNILFPPGTYSFKNVVVDHPVTIVGLGATFEPIHKLETANASYSMLLFSDISRVKIENIKVQGSYIDGSYVDGEIVADFQNGDKSNTTSIFKFTNVDCVDVSRVSFKDLDGSYRLPAQANWYDRNAICMTFLDCSEVNLDRVDVQYVHGDEWLWKIYSGSVNGGLDYKDGISRITNCIFKHNKLPGSAFGFVGGIIFVEDNYFEDYFGTGSLINVFGTDLYVRHNVGRAINVGSIVDTCEGYYYKNEYAEFLDNDFDNRLGLIGFKVNTKKFVVQQNRIVTRCAVMYLIYPSNTATPIQNCLDDATRYKYESYLIKNNQFTDLYDGAEAPDERYGIIDIGYHSGYAAAEDVTIDIGEISDNTLKSIRTNATEPIVIYDLADQMDVHRNKFLSMGANTSSPITLHVIRVYNTTKVAPVLRVSNNFVSCKNYAIGAPYTRYTIFFTTGTAGLFTGYFYGNITDMVDSGSAAVLLEQYNTCVAIVNNDIGFKAA